MPGVERGVKKKNVPRPSSAWSAVARRPLGTTGEAIHVPKWWRWERRLLVQVGHPRTSAGCAWVVFGGDLFGDIDIAGLR